ncbi:MAG: hypothetical protein HY843_00310, partial [Bdellovibrio sp.]|nr:hypothetical protein [Bdellovibrio sp.]
DNLVLISTDIYGKSSKWKKIWENNKQLIRDPNRIFAGFYLYYTMTAEEKDEAGKLKLHQQVKPAPIVKQDQPDTNGTAQIGSPAVSMDQLAPPIDTSAASPSEVNERNPATK